MTTIATESSGRAAPAALPITVLVPCFNDGTTLRQAVASALAEPVQHVLIVDDGSTDPHTLGVLAGFDDDRVRVVHQANQGPSAARSLGLGYVSTPYVFNLDADDYLLPTAIVQLYEALAADGSRQVVWGDYRITGHRNRTQRTAETIDAWHLTLVNDLPMSALFRTQPLRAVGGWQASGYEDWDLWLCYAKNGLAGCRVSVVVLVRRTATDSDRMLAQHEKDHDRLMAEIVSRHRELFTARIRHWVRSPAPRRVRVVLPVLCWLLRPFSDLQRKRLLWGANQFLQMRDWDQSKRPSRTPGSSITLARRG
jgi:glycosyltransferase involved in cell wall biosynthesis